VDIADSAAPQVILIHLSNLTGLKKEYSKRTMFLLVSDLGCIVWGSTAAFTKGPTKALFFIIGCLYSMNTFFHASKVYIESYHMVPRGICKKVVMVLAYMFFISWMGFPLSFLAGEGIKGSRVGGQGLGAEGFGCGRGRMEVQLSAPCEPHRKAAAASVWLSLRGPSAEAMAGRLPRSSSLAHPPLLSVLALAPAPPLTRHWFRTVILPRTSRSVCCLPVHPA